MLIHLSFVAAILPKTLKMFLNPTTVLENCRDCISGVSSDPAVRNACIIRYHQEYFTGDQFLAVAVNIHVPKGGPHKDVFFHCATNVDGNMEHWMNWAQLRDPPESKNTNPFPGHRVGYRRSQHFQTACSHTCQEKAAEAARKRKHSCGEGIYALLRVGADIDGFTREVKMPYPVQPNSRFAPRDVRFVIELLVKGKDLGEGIKQQVIREYDFTTHVFCTEGWCTCVTDFTHQRDNKSYPEEFTDEHDIPYPRSPLNQKLSTVDTASYYAPSSPPSMESDSTSQESGSMISRNVENTAGRYVSRKFLGSVHEIMGGDSQASRGGVPTSSPLFTTGKDTRRMGEVQMGPAERGDRLRSDTQYPGLHSLGDINDCPPKYKASIDSLQGDQNGTEFFHSSSNPGPTAGPVFSDEINSQDDLDGLDGLFPKDRGDIHPDPVDQAGIESPHRKAELNPRARPSSSPEKTPSPPCAPRRRVQRLVISIPRLSSPTSPSSSPPRFLARDHHHHHHENNEQQHNVERKITNGEARRIYDQLGFMEEEEQARVERLEAHNSDQHGIPLPPGAKILEDVDYVQSPEPLSPAYGTPDGGGERSGSDASFEELVFPPTRAPETRVELSWREKLAAGRDDVDPSRFGPSWDEDLPPPKQGARGHGDQENRRSRPTSRILGTTGADAKLFPGLERDSPLLDLPPPPGHESAWQMERDGVHWGAKQSRESASKSSVVGDRHGERTYAEQEEEEDIAATARMAHETLGMLDQAIKDIRLSHKVDGVHDEEEWAKKVSEYSDHRDSKAPCSRRRGKQLARLGDDMEDVNLDY
ncbi:hypothetical protein MKZ38_010409 [Zalerion maritima]|uniref:Uncharacterized protein n=1 Tax=Zalerion maritima TaxID=339359 RepID=A0AAD5WSI6_9PEZI|nr:hypothetical protein MKZ38_010409 [Zalerion maritima]